jgi:hypothetical protein
MKLDKRELKRLAKSTHILLIESGITEICVDSLARQAELSTSIASDIYQYWYNLEGWKKKPDDTVYLLVPPLSDKNGLDHIPTNAELADATKRLALQALQDGDTKVLPAAISAFLTSWDESTVAAALDKGREDFIIAYRERLKPLLTSEQIKQLEQEVRVATAKIHLD